MKEFNMKFVIEQIAICPPRSDKAIDLLQALGLTDWVYDIVHARGEVRELPAENTARLAFNYDAAPAGKLEFEVLDYIDGPNWMSAFAPQVSHLGMHCTAEELEGWRELFAWHGVPVAQEVLTQSHVNPVIAGKRWYQYVIFNTRPVLGVDLKFIVRRDSPPE